MVPFMGQITIRGLSVDLPALDAGTELDALPSLGGPAGLISGFDFSGARVPALELKDVTLVTGKVSRVQAGETSMTGTQVRSVEFAGCELGSLQWTGGKISRTRFSNCQLVGAHFEDVTFDQVIFADCKMDYAMLSRIRAAGPVIFAGCSLREAEFADCHLTGSLFSRCDLTLTGFGSGRYARCDLRDNDLSTVTGIHYLKQVILDRAQLMQLAEALAAELRVTLGDSLDDHVYRRGDDAPGGTGPQDG
jgi:uncharacterized protein YjbI with pentapeptide repeats